MGLGLAVRMFGWQRPKGCAVGVSNTQDALRVLQTSAELWCLLVHLKYVGKVINATQTQKDVFSAPSVILGEQDLVCACTFTYISILYTY